MPATYAVGLIILFYALVILEFLIPSGGVIGIGAAIAGLTAIIVAFTHSLSMGLWFLLIVLVSTPALLAALVRLWPRTRIGRQMLNSLPANSEDGNLNDGPKTRTGIPLAELVGRIGLARCDLLPSGEVTIDDCHVDAVSLGQPIDKGSPVRVVRVKGRSLQVLPAEGVDNISEVGLPVRKVSVATEQDAGHGANGLSEPVPSSGGLLDEVDLDALDTQPGDDDSESGSMNAEEGDR